MPEDAADVFHIDRLPNELLDRILSYLQLHELLLVRKVSLRWADTGLVILSRWKQLNYLEDISGHGLTGTTMEMLLPMMPSLKSLTFASAPRLRPRVLDVIGLEVVVTNCPKLEKIDLTIFRTSELSIKQLCIACPNLVDVTADEIIEDELLVLLRHLPKLRRLQLPNLSPIFSEKCLAELPIALESLELDYNADIMSSDGLQQLARCSMLRELTIYTTEVYESYGFEYYGPDLAIGLAGCPLLEKLTLENLNARLEDSLPSAGIPTLRYLKVSNIDFVTSESEMRLPVYLDSHTMDMLPTLVPGLQSLILPKCDVSDIQFYRFTQLRELNLIGACVFGDCLDTLHGLPITSLCLSIPLHMKKDRLTPGRIARMVLACPSLTTLALCSEDSFPRGKRFCRALVDALQDELSADRSVTLYVPEDYLQDLPAGPLRMVNQKESGYCEDHISCGVDDEEWTSDEDEVSRFIADTYHGNEIWW